ncbi:unnamed protein product [Closterium sp. Yama58-4]|nr:unnamed protein product [Closterium sp. Yama58-4]
MASSLRTLSTQLLPKSLQITATSQDAGFGRDCTRALRFRYPRTNQTVARRSLSLAAARSTALSRTPPSRTSIFENQTPRSGKHHVQKGVRVSAVATDEQGEGEGEGEGAECVARADRPLFDLNLAVLLAGFAFESYNEPQESKETLWEEDVGGCRTIFTSYGFAYELYSGQLIVTVHSASDVPAVDLWGTSDPYVLAAVGEASARTRTIWTSTAPEWNEEIRLLVNADDTSPKYLKSQLSMWDDGIVISPRRLGNASIRLDDLLDGRILVTAIVLRQPSTATATDSSPAPTDGSAAPATSQPSPAISTYEFVRSAIQQFGAPSAFPTSLDKIRDSVISTQSSTPAASPTENTAENAECGSRESSDRQQQVRQAVGLAREVLLRAGWIPPGGTLDQLSQAVIGATAGSGTSATGGTSGTGGNSSSSNGDSAPAGGAAGGAAASGGFDLGFAAAAAAGGLLEGAAGAVAGRIEQRRAELRRSLTDMGITLPWYDQKSGQGADGQGADGQGADGQGADGQSSGLDVERTSSGDFDQDVMVHGGFLAAYDSVRARLRSLIAIITDPNRPAPLTSHSSDADADADSSIHAADSLSEGDTWRVYLTGHSLGGALATLFAYELSQSNLVRDRNIHLTMYNYGSPRVGNAAFVARFNVYMKDSWRIVNRADIVPTVPKLMGYRHVCCPVYLSPGGPSGDLQADASQEQLGVDDGYAAEVVGEANANDILEDYMKGERRLIDRLLQTEVAMLSALRDGSAIMMHMEDFYYIALLKKVRESLGVSQ